MSKGARWGAMRVLGALVMTTVVASGRASAETYTATASVKTAGGASATAPVTITINRWTTDAERAKAVEAMKKGDAALKATLDGLPAAGTLQVGGRSTPLHYARTLSTGAGKLVTIVATEPLAFLGAGMANPKPRAGYQFTFATFEVGADGKGTAGDLAPAAKLKLGTGDAVVVDDYGSEAIRLTAIASKK